MMRFRVKDIDTGEWRILDAQELVTLILGEIRRDVEPAATAGDTEDDAT